MLWMFWPAVSAAFIAAFSLGHHQVRTGCNTARATGLVCRTLDTPPNARLDLATVRQTSERVLNDTMIRGAAIEDLQWRETAAGPGKTPHDHPFSVGIVEFDDRGHANSGAQVDAVKKLVATTLESSDALVVTFIHGWNNDCAACNGNVACFREVLALLSAVEADIAPWIGARPRPVIGIYVGWRGKTMRIRFANTMSVFSRTIAAGQLGAAKSDLTSFLSWLNQEKVRANEPGRYANRASAVGRLTSPLGSRHVEVGHSFGATALFKSIIGRVGMVPGTSLRAGDRWKADQLADLTVLVNPAFEANLYRDFDALAGKVFANEQIPPIVTVQATNDWVTRRAFPIERALVLSENPATWNRTGPELLAFGHYTQYFTHSLCQPGQADCPATGTPDASEDAGHLLAQIIKPPSTAPCGCAGLEASRDFHAALLKSMKDALDQPEGSNEHVGEPMKRLASNLEPLNPQVNVDRPFLVVRATPDIVDKHQGMYRGQFFDFLANMLIRQQLLRLPELRETIRHRI